MQGTIQRNLLHRLGDAWHVAVKGLPTPAELYPPRFQGGGDTGPHWISWQGWDQFSKESGAQDENRVKKAVQSPSVFANMRAIATEFASSELVVKERKGAKLEDIDNHPLEVLWEAPNPDMGRSFLMAFWAWSYTMTGKAYLYWLPAGDGIQELWPIPPFMIRAIPARKEFIGGYLFKSSEKADPILIPREYITYSHSPNIFDIRDSLSFLAAGMTPIESEIAMGLWNRNFFDESNGIPDGIIALDKNALDADVTRVRMELRDFFGGTKRGVGVTRAGDMEYHAWGRSQVDAQFTEGIKLASTQIGRLMGFPDGYWSESANRANAEQARATMIAGAVWPLLVALHEDMNAGAVKRFWGEQFRAEFKDIRPEDRALKLQELAFYAQIETVNELRERIGSDALEDPRGEMFVVEIGKGTPIPATPAAEMTEEFVAALEEEAAAEVEEEPLPEEGAEELPVEETTEDGLPLEEEAVEPEEAPMPMKNIVYRGQFGDLPLSEDMLLDAGFTKSDTGWVAPPNYIEAAMAKDADLERWERKALKALRRFHAADVRFESNAIPLPQQVRIHEALKAAETQEEVRAAFKADADLDPLIASEWDAALAWAGRVSE